MQYQAKIMCIKLVLTYNIIQYFGGRVTTREISRSIVLRGVLIFMINVPAHTKESIKWRTHNEFDLLLHRECIFGSTVLSHSRPAWSYSMKIS